MRESASGPTQVAAGEVGAKILILQFPRAPLSQLCLQKDISLQHGIKIGGFQVHSSGKRVVVVGGLDNLLKGAATQCIQVCDSPRKCIKSSTNL
jgi:hypothetical protein